MRVSIPPIELAKARGMSRRAALVPVAAHMLTTMGIISATVPVLLTNAPMAAVAPMTRKYMRTGLSPARRIMRPPIICARPVRSTAPPTTNSPTIITTIGLLKPDRASGTVRMPASVSTMSAPRATMSERTRPSTNSTAAARSVRSVSSISQNRVFKISSEREAEPDKAPCRA